MSMNIKYIICAIFRIFTDIFYGTGSLGEKALSRGSGSTWHHCLLRRGSDCAGSAAQCRVAGLEAPKGRGWTTGEV